VVPFPAGGGIHKYMRGVGIVSDEMREVVE